MNVIVKQRSESTFECDDTQALADWLRQEGFEDVPTRLSYEVARLASPDRRTGLVRIHQSGVVCTTNRHAKRLLKEAIESQDTRAIYRQRHFAIHDYWVSPGHAQ